MPGLLSIADTGGPSLDPKLARVYMIPLKDATEGGGFDDDKERAFQYWPETMQDSRGDVGWQEKAIPGLSHPLMQWTQGGSRRISFTVVFGRDRYELPDLDDPRTEEWDLEENVDIGAAAAWLRWYTYPLYKEGDFRVIAPPSIMLVMPLTAIGGIRDGGLHQDAILTVMTSCDITYLSWFPNGVPRLAEASLEFAEIIQGSLGHIYPHSRDVDFAGAFDLYPLRKKDE